MIAAARAILDVLAASLVQGVCIAAVAGAFSLLVGRRINAATRCVVWQLALLAILVTPLVSTLINDGGHGSVLVGGHGIAGSAAERPGRPGLRELFGLRRFDVALGDRLAFVSVALWLVGVDCFGVRIVASYLQLIRMVRRSVRLNDRDGVRMYASADLRVPLAFGFRSPSIALPSAPAIPLVDGSGILLHELAHIHRRDALANVCERASHALLFFNPAVGLVWRAIAFEREAACDDWAVAKCRDIVTYTRTLATFALSTFEAGSLAACGASGFGRSIVGRIKRLEDARRNGAIALSRYAL